MHGKAPQKAPINRRKPSSRALANKAKVLKAIFRNATDHGLDQLSIGQVAKRAGLTTGAIYGRFEDRDELAVELWQSVVKEPFRARLERSVEYISNKQRGGDPQISVSSNRAELQTLLTSDFESPNEIAKLGAEFLVVARRDLAIGEVVVPEVAQWLSLCLHLSALHCVRLPSNRTRIGLQSPRVCAWHVPMQLRLRARKI
jgi:AcrR family transcriptional regulator